MLQYKDVDFDNPLYDFGASATVGIQNSPTQGVQYSYNSPSLANELAILFLPPGQSVEHPAYDTDVSFQVQVQDVPINTWITNTAILPNFYGPFHATLGEHADQHRRSERVHQVDRSPNGFSRAKR